MPIPVYGSEGSSIPKVSVFPAPFPARVKEATASVGLVSTEVSVTYFVDKILITIAQEGRLAHWVHVPLESASPNQSERQAFPSGALDDDAEPIQGLHLLPLTHLTATTILGGGDEDRNTLGQLIATQIASAIARKEVEEKRLLVVGMGFKDSELDREAYVQLLRLVARCL